VSMAAKRPESKALDPNSVIVCPDHGPAGAGRRFGHLCSGGNARSGGGA
jgi:hypothetical protein